MDRLRRQFLAGRPRWHADYRSAPRFRCPSSSPTTFLPGRHYAIHLGTLSSMEQGVADDQGRQLIQAALSASTASVIFETVSLDTSGRTPRHTFLRRRPVSEVSDRTI